MNWFNATNVSKDEIIAVPVLGDRLDCQVNEFQFHQSLAASRLVNLTPSIAKSQGMQHSTIFCNSVIRASYIANVRKSNSIGTRKKLILNFPTRWWSNILMLEHFRKLREYVDGFTIKMHTDKFGFKN